MGPCPGEAAGTGVWVTSPAGWSPLLRPFPPLDCGTPSNTQIAHPKHIISTVTLLSWSPSLPFVGETECISGYAQRYLSAINPPTRTPTFSNLRRCFSQLLASELQYGSHVAFSLTKVQQGVTRRSSLCRQTHPQPRFPSPCPACLQVLCRHRLPISVVLS